MIQNLTLILLYFLLFLACVGLISSLLTRRIEKDHKRGRHWNTPHPDVCDFCKAEKEKQDGTS